MGYAIEAVAYVGGVALIGAGLFLVLRGSFPAWWPKWFAWPLDHFTPAVSRLQGAVAIGLGASIMLLVFTTVAPGTLAGWLVVVAMAMYLISVLLFLFSTWLSRRPAT